MQKVWTQGVTPLSKPCFLFFHIFLFNRYSTLANNTGKEKIRKQKCTKNLVVAQKTTTFALS